MNFRQIRIYLLACLLAGPCLGARAESVLLKSGEKVEGTIIHQNETEIEIKVPISSSVFDVRTIARADIEHIEQPDPSSKEFAALQALALRPNSSASQDYDNLIASKLVPFLAKYPKSTHLQEMQEIIASLSDEKRRVMRGETKIGNEWFTPWEMVAEKEQIQATLAYQQIAASESITALNLFARYEKKYPGAKTYPVAVEENLARIAQLRQTILPNLKKLPERLAAREAGWALTSEPLKSQLIAAAKTADQDTKDSLEAARKAGDLWMPLAPNSKESLKALLQTADSETMRLSKLPLGAMKASIAASEEGRKKLTAGELDEAAECFQKAASLWPASLMNRRNTILLVEARKAAEPTPAPKPSPAN